MEIFVSGHFELKLKKIYLLAAKWHLLQHSTTFARIRGRGRSLLCCFTLPSKQGWFESPRMVWKNPRMVWKKVWFLSWICRRTGFKDPFEMFCFPKHSQRLMSRVKWWSLRIPYGLENRWNLASWERFFAKFCQIKFLKMSFQLCNHA